MRRNVTHHYARGNKYAIPCVVRERAERSVGTAMQGQESLEAPECNGLYLGSHSPCHLPLKVIVEASLSFASANRPVRNGTRYIIIRRRDFSISLAASVLRHRPGNLWAFDLGRQCRDSPLEVFLERRTGGRVLHRLTVNGQKCGRSYLVWTMLLDFLVLIFLIHEVDLQGFIFLILSRGSGVILWWMVVGIFGGSFGEDDSMIFIGWN